MEVTEQSSPKDDLAKKIFEWPKKNPVLSMLAIGALSAAIYAMSGPAGGVETCNDSGVVRTLETSLMEKTAGVITLLKQSPEFRSPENAKILADMKSISASVSSIIQVGFDKDSKMRTCEGSVSYSNYSEAYTPMLRVFGARMCSGRVRYRITRPLDSPKTYSINWACD